MPHEMGASVMTMPEATRAVQMYAEGYSQPQIAKALGRTRTAVRTAFKQLGVKQRTPTEGVREWVKRRNQPLTRQQIADKFTVDPITGRVYWCWPDRPKQYTHCTGEAGCLRKPAVKGGKPYWFIKINGIPYKRSYIVFAFVTGRWPTDMLDHKNGDSVDDRFCNLREATALQNARNRSANTSRTDLPMGVRRMGDRFQARINVDKKLQHLGTFATAEAAAAAYQGARKHYFGEFA